MFKSEINFLNRRLRRTDIAWEARPAVSQLMSQVLADDKATALHNELRNILEARSGKLVFEQMAKIVSPKTGGKRVVISIKLLREKFAGEIEGDAGGGGRGYNPLRTTPTRGGR